MAVLVPWDIAIIGTACRFPGAASIADFWNNLAAGVERWRDLERLFRVAASPRGHPALPRSRSLSPTM